MNKHIIALSLLAAIGAGISTSAQATGFQIAEYSATGLGRAYAGDAAIADGASAQFRNPAMMTYLPGTQVSGGVVGIFPEINLDGAMGPLHSRAHNMAENATVPNFYITHQFNNHWTAGLAVASNFGLETNLKRTGYLFTAFGDQAKLHTIEINPNIAYKINDAFSVGAGVRYVRANGHFGSSMAGMPIAYVQGKDNNAWGWQLGAAWQINPSNRIGINYRSAVHLNLKGTATAMVNAQQAAMKLAMPEILTAPGNLPLTLPQTVEIAGVHQVNDRLSLSSSVNWTNWSSFKTLSANSPVLGGHKVLKEEQWNNAYRIAVGADYKATQKLTLRSGVAFDSSAVRASHRSQTIPETDLIWLSAGAGYQFTPNFSVDGGMSYIFAREGSMSETNPMLGTMNGRVSGGLWLFGLQGNYRF